MMLSAQSPAASSLAYTDLRLYQPAGSATPFSGPSPYGLSPQQIRHAYGFDQVLLPGTSTIGDGTGQTIAIIDAFNDPNIRGDLSAFDQQFGLTDPTTTTFQIVSQSGSTTNLPGNGAMYPNDSWVLEESLDVETIHALAPGANILLVEANSASPSDLLAAVNYASQQPGVVAVSMSFGYPESSADLNTNTDFTTPSGHGGITFIAATGDTGQPGYYPAFSPNVLAVGGTTLNVDSSGNYQSETAWDESGGGISTVESQPAYQTGVVTQTSANRATPDVAFDGDPNTGISIYDSYDFGTTTPWVRVGGTSLGSPAWASLVAIADQARATLSLNSLDGATQTLPILYAASSSDFNDITSGSNNVSSAGPGYDLVTGRGTPKAPAIVNDLIGSFAVVAATPAINGTVSTPPTDFAITLSSPYNGTGIVASDLSVNGITADSVAQTNSTTLTFHYNSSPVSAQGLQTMTIAAGVFTRQGDGAASSAFNATFRYDALQIAVDSATPANGSIASLPLGTITLHFNEAYLISSIATTNITLSQGSVTGYSRIDGQTVAYSVSGINNAGTLIVNMAAGAVTDVYGNPGAAYSETLYLNGQATAFPTLQAVSPLGSLVYQNSAAGSVLFAGNVVSYTLTLAAGQTLTLVGTAASALQAQLTLTGPGVNSTTSAAAAGANVGMQSVVINTAGTYTISVTGVNGTTGRFSLQALLNAAASSAMSGGAGNQSLATAEDIDGAFSTLAGASKLAAVLNTPALPVGPNNFGYEAISVPSQFEDISESGTEIFGSTDTTQLGVALSGNSLPGRAISFYGTSYTTLYVGLNGVMSFSVGNLTATNTNLTSPNSTIIAPLWDGISMSGSPDSAVYYQRMGTGASQRLIVEWYDVSFTNGPQTGQATFEAIFNANGTIIFNYQNFDRSLLASTDAGPTVGIKNSNAATNGADPLLVTNSVAKLPLIASGTSIEIGQNIAPATSDFYAFSMAAGQTVSLAVASQNGDAVHVALEDANGNTLAADSSPGAGANVTEAIQNFTATTAGTYYAAVTGAPAAAYSLIVGRNTAFDTQTGGSIATAQDVTGSPGVVGAILAAPATPQENWYNLNLTAGEGLYLQTYTLGGASGQFVDSLAPHIELYDPSDNLIASGQGAGNQAIGVAISASGAYRVRVVGQNSTSGEYFLQTAIEAAPPTVAVAAVSPNPRNSAVSQMQIVFSEPVTGVSLSALSLTLNGGANLLTSNQTLTTSDNTTYTLAGLTALTGTNGTYTLSVNAAGSGIADFAGDALASGGSGSFTVNTTPPEVAAVYVSGTSWSSSFLTYLAANGMGDAQLGYQLLGGANQLTPLPWTNITTISVVFTQDVTVNTAQAGLAIYGSPDLAAPASLSSAAFSYNSATHTAQWTFAAPLTDDKYLLAIPSAAVANTLGTALDGEFTNATATSPGGNFPSGDGVAGGDFDFRFNVLPGNSSQQNGIVTGADGNGVRARLLQNTTMPLYSPFYDLNGDGTIAGSDGSAVRLHLLQSLPATDPSPQVQPATGVAGTNQPNGAIATTPPMFSTSLADGITGRLPVAAQGSGVGAQESAKTSPTTTTVTNAPAGAKLPTSTVLDPATRFQIMSAANAGLLPARLTHLLQPQQIISIAAASTPPPRAVVAAGASAAPAAQVSLAKPTLGAAGGIVGSETELRDLLLEHFGATGGFRGFRLLKAR